MGIKRYIRAATADECIHSLSKWGPEAAILAGGTDLIPKIRQRKCQVSTIVDISAIEELNQIEKNDAGLFLGAMCRLRPLQNDSCLAGPFAVIRQGAGQVSNMQVRNVATLGGNICNASPAADTVPALLVLDAVAHIRGKTGIRKVLLETFFTGPGEILMEHDEMLTGVFLPHPPPKTGAIYKKYAIRGSSDISIIGAAALIRLDEGGLVSQAHIALAAVGPTPLRMRREEQMFVGQRPDEKLLAEVAQACAESINPLTDMRATKEYRKDMVRVWLKEAIQEAVAAAKM